MFRPSITDMQDKYCGRCYDIYLIQSQYTKVAAFGRHHKRGDAAFGRATSFVVSFIYALNGASILALSRIYDLCLSKTGRTGVGRTVDRMDGRSDAVSLYPVPFLAGPIPPKRQMASPHMSYVPRSQLSWLFTRYTSYNSTMIGAWSWLASVLIRSFSGFPCSFSAGFPLVAP